jgi:hypothetical protein
MADKKAVITDEERLKRGQSVPLTDTGETDKEIPEIPADERGSGIQPRDHDDEDVDRDDLDVDPDADDGDDGLVADKE